MKRVKYQVPTEAKYNQTAEEWPTVSLISDELWRFVHGRDKFDDLSRQDRG